MRKIYGIGETVLDIIFKGDQPQAAKAGGSVLNSVTSMGRMGLPVSFISEYGIDDVGELIDTFLNENGVNTSAVHRFSNGSTSLALAFLMIRMMHIIHSTRIFPANVSILNSQSCRLRISFSLALFMQYGLR